MRVEELIRKAYPGSEIVPRSGGELNTVFEVRRSADPDLIVKVYAPESTWTASGNRRTGTSPTTYSTRCRRTRSTCGASSP